MGASVVFASPLPSGVKSSEELLIVVLAWGLQFLSLWGADTFGVAIGVSFVDFLVSPVPSVPSTQAGRSHLYTRLAQFYATHIIVLHCILLDAILSSVDKKRNQRTDELWVIGQRLRNARMRAGHTLAQMSELTGVNKSNLSRAENGLTMLHPTSLKKIMDHLSLSTEDVFGKESRLSGTYPDPVRANDIREIDAPKYEDDPDILTYELTVDLPSMHLLEGDILYVLPMGIPEHRDLILTDSASGFALIRVLKLDWPGSSTSFRIVRYEHEQIDARTPEEGGTIVGLVVEVRRPRKTLSRPPIRMSMDPE